MGRFDIVIHLHSLCLRCLSSLWLLIYADAESAKRVARSICLRRGDSPRTGRCFIIPLRGCSGRAHFVRTILFIYFAAGREEERSKYMLSAAIAAESQLRIRLALIALEMHENVARRAKSEQNMVYGKEQSCRSYVRKTISRSGLTI